MNGTIIIPSRLNSVRVPNKPLREVGGKTVIRSCFDCCVESELPVYLVIDEDLYKGVGGDRFGDAFWRDRLHSPDLDYDPVIVIKEPFKNGTERVAAAAKKLGLQGDDIVINVQGDMVKISPEIIRDVFEKKLSLDSKTVCTAYYSIPDGQAWIDQNRVKVRINSTFDIADQFFRKGSELNVAIPETQYGIHIGIYAYSASFLYEYADAPQCYSEIHFDLEQLRIWDLRGLMALIFANEAPLVIDSEYDLRVVEGVHASS